MTTPIDEGVRSNETGDEAHSLIGHEPGDVNSASIRSRTTVTSKQVPRQIKAATHRVTRQLNRLCDLLKHIRQVLLSPDEETTGLIQSHHWAHKKGVS